MNIHINCTDDGTVKYPPHKHDYWEIMLYLEGEGYMYNEQKDIPFETGTIIIMPPGVVHGSVSEKGFKNISIGGEFENFFFSNEPIAAKDNQIKEGTSLAKIILESRIADERYMKSLTEAYLCYISRLISSKKQTTAAIDKIVVKITENAFEPDLKVTALLIESGYNEDYIREQFRKETGMRPTEYLTKIRIEHARFLIDVYGQSFRLSEIAEKCGYTDYIYFSKQFKRYIGVSPRIYLKQKCINKSNILKA